MSLKASDEKKALALASLYSLYLRTTSPDITRQMELSDCDEPFNAFPVRPAISTVPSGIPVLLAMALPSVPAITCTA